MTATEDPTMVATLKARLEELEQANEDAERARESRDRIIREAVARGVSKYRVAQLTGLSQPMIGRIAAGAPKTRRTVSEEQIDALGDLLHSAGITCIPRLKRPLGLNGQRPWFYLRWVSDLTAKELPGWYPERATVWGEDPDAPVTIDQRVFSVDPDHPEDWRNWLRYVLLDGPQGGQPQRVVEGLSGWWRDPGEEER